MSLYLWIALGSALGGLARYGLVELVTRHVAPGFPWGTLFVNLLGSFVIGLFATLTGPDGRFLAGLEARHFVMTGVLGGFTTYSAFSLQTLALAREGAWVRAGANATATFILCFVAVWLGHLVALWLNARR